MVRLASGGWRPAHSRVPSSASAQFLRTAFSRAVRMSTKASESIPAPHLPEDVRHSTSLHLERVGTWCVVDVQCTATAHFQTHTRVTVLKRACPGFLINHRRPLFHSMTRTAGFVPLCCSGGDYTITRHYQRLLRARKNKVRV